MKIYSQYKNNNESKSQYLRPTKISIDIQDNSDIQSPIENKNYFNFLKE